ncbi:MAG: aldehyde ferredoxin oxidoreductase family protein [Candidatus Thermoplasmatota archaeon]|nr:aldehyde ferredoxin oxidoreductase family protein [Candidatus Thermoplasmatota archaeon]
MSGGYTGKMLNINVTTRHVTVEETDMESAREFIGAKGLGAKILFDRLPMGTNPLAPENILMFTTGPLTGTSTQTSGRGTVVTKSPQTGLYVDSHFGGIFAAEMKKAGWDVILLTGRSNTPVYLLIKDDTVAFKDASALWGKECLATHHWLQKTEGRVKTAVIGPAGEHRVAFSAITIDGHRHAGRGGNGAVMGSKNLKAIVVTGTKKIPIHDPERFRLKTKEVLQKIQENGFIPLRRKYGTPFWVKPVNDWGLLPTRNYQEGYFEQGDAINAEAMQEKIVDGSGACYNCVIACWNQSSIKSGPYKNVSLVGPEYETIALMGSNLGVGKIEDIAYLNERCNELGMDTISLGGVLGFAIEAYEKGAITNADLGGHAIGWGKTKELAELIDDIAYRRGAAGGLLAEGVRAASSRLQKGSEQYAVQVKGLEIPGYDPRGAFGMGLAYATSDRGGCHQRAWTVTAEINNPNFHRFSFEKKAHLVKKVQDERSAFFSLVLCDFAPISETDCVSMWNLASGFDHTVESYLLAGERIWNLIRLFNLRETQGSLVDTLPPRFYKDPFTKGPVNGILIPKEGFQRSVEEYYSLRGWDRSGIPTAAKLKELRLSAYGKASGVPV